MGLLGRDNPYADGTVVDRIARLSAPAPVTLSLTPREPTDSIEPVKPLRLNEGGGVLCALRRIVRRGHDGRFTGVDRVAALDTGVWICDCDRPLTPINGEQPDNLCTICMTVITTSKPLSVAESFVFHRSLSPCVPEQLPHDASRCRCNRSEER
jgi:hypothetical protein